ncbi:hypothetical protein [Goodfellowiella coeruleoviolacea]|uniref:Transglycosylase SLT domain-containing protein n=1 Tax=Goodfellowiella coeruleoviolacea TaxID=334858 RepID=A0AAE3KKG9_9PSEU|nr:hypothetical protein [Goodfellowiella coeruleoviolacea]MCP2170152.1 hypothetical protein [Goodfellowiella coeruleoviolacea]
MPQLTDEEIARHAADAGFTGSDLETAVAVALAESHGDSDALGDLHLRTEVYGPSVGLWQIRSVNPGHGGWFDQAHRNEQANLDPATNARNAYAIRERYGWRDWSTYTSGRYRQFLDRAQRAVRSPNAGTAPAPSTPDPAAGQRSSQSVQPVQSQRGSSNPGGMAVDLAELIRSMQRLLNPGKQISDAARMVQAGTRVAAGAFGGTAGAGVAASANARTVQECTAQAERSAQELERMRAGMKSVHDAQSADDRARATQLNLLVDPAIQRNATA